VIGRFGPIRGLKAAFDGTGKEKFNQALITPAFCSFQKVLAWIDALDLKLLACPDAVLAAQFGGQDNLSLA